MEVLLADEIDEILVPDPTGSGVGTCIIRGDRLLRLRSIAGAHELHELERHIVKLAPGEPITIEVDELDEADVAHVIALAQARRRGVFVRKRR